MKISILFLLMLLTTSLFAQEVPLSEDELMESSEQQTEYGPPIENEDHIQRQEDISQEEIPVEEWSFNSEEEAPVENEDLTSLD